jgi:hypothetical protein
MTSTLRYFCLTHNFTLHRIFQGCCFCVNQELCVCLILWWRDKYHHKIALFDQALWRLLTSRMWCSLVLSIVTRWSAGLHGVTSQKPVIFTVTAVRTSDFCVKISCFRICLLDVHSSSVYICEVIKLFCTVICTVLRDFTIEVGKKGKVVPVLN